MAARFAQPTFWVLALLFACGLALRVGFVHTTKLAEPIHSDALQYLAYASNLVDRGVYSKDTTAPPTPDSFRAPGYPMLVALSLWIAADDGVGTDNAAYRFLLDVQAVLGALMVPLTFALGRRFLPTWAAVVAAGAVALSPHLVSLTFYVLTAPLYGLLALAGVTAFTIALEKRRVAWFAGSGLLLSGAFLTNSTALPLPLIFAGLALTLCGFTRGSSDWRRVATHLAVFIAVFFTLPAAWSVRNAVNVPDGARTGSDRAFSTMTHGIYPGWVHEDPRLRYYAYRDDPQAKEIRSSLGSFARILWERVRERPARYLSWFLVEKPYYGWSWNILQGEGDVYVYLTKASLYRANALADATRRTMKLLHPLVLIATCLGLPLCLVGLRSLRGSALLVATPVLLAALVVYYTAVFVVFAPWPRYSIPLRPELYLFAMWSALAVARRVADFAGARPAT